MARPNLKSGYDLVPQSQSSGWVACLIRIRAPEDTNFITNHKPTISQYCSTGVSPWTVWQASHPLCLLSSHWEKRRRSAAHTTWQRMASWGRSAAVDCLSCSGYKQFRNTFPFSIQMQIISIMKTFQMEGKSLEECLETTFTLFHPLPGNFPDL